MLSLFLPCTDTALPYTSPLPLHDALPISAPRSRSAMRESWSAPPTWKTNRIPRSGPTPAAGSRASRRLGSVRSEEHTSELQSLRHLVCRLLLEIKKYTAASQKRRTEYPLC